MNSLGQRRTAQLTDDSVLMQAHMHKYVIIYNPCNILYQLVLLHMQLQPHLRKIKEGTHSTGHTVCV